MMHTDLEVYKSSMALVKQIYIITGKFPREEIWGLASQMKRAAISIPANIAEGCGRRSTKELLNYLNIALGSLTELLTHIEISEMLGFVTDSSDPALARETALSVKRLLLSLIRSNENKLKT